jgi:putative hydrolase of the HAD superfamily
MAEGMSLLVRGHCAVQYYPRRRIVTTARHTGRMVTAVIFDFYGTLAQWADREAAGYAAVFSAHGYALAPEDLNEYFRRYDGVEHRAHSATEEDYEAWARSRLRDLARTCRVDPEGEDALIDALRASDRGAMVAYPEAARTLRSLRQCGMAVGVCSNWGWELDGFLEQVGLLDLVDSTVTSARAGARKPYPSIYGVAAASLGVRPDEALFVGDSWEPDVRGPRRAGMAAVHVWREEERDGLPAPPLQPGDRRVAELSGLLEVLGLPVG